MRALLLAALVSLAPASRAQHAHHAPPPSGLTAQETQFLDATRVALAALSDPERALAAGFRPLGPDMPHMGQHWVHPGRAVSRDLDPSQPAMLTFLDVGGRSVLTGAAFTVPVGPDQAPPSFPSADAWHAHAGRLMDEAFGLVPHGADRPRLAMLHAWTGVANPDGVWAADNWALPFVRGGYAVPAHLTPHAGRAVALAVGYGGFFREVVDRAARPSPAERDSVAQLLTRHRSQIQDLLDRTPAGTAPDADALGEAWRALWADLEASLPRVAGRTAALFGTDGHTGTHAIHP